MPGTTQTRVTPRRIPFGIDERGKHLHFDLDADRHLVIGGRAGSGKSRALQVIEEIATASGAEVRSTRSNDRVESSDPVRAVRVLQDCIAAIPDLPPGCRPMIVVIDDYPGLVSPQPWADDAEAAPSRQRVVTLIEQLVIEGTGRDIHLVIAGQRVPGRNAREHAALARSARLYLGTSSEADRRGFFSDPERVPPLEDTVIRGVGVYQDGAGELHPVAVFRPDQANDEALHAGVGPDTVHCAASRSRPFAGVDGEEEAR